MELIMFVGIPASGKSTRSRYYRQRGYEILSSDAIREELLQGTGLQELSEQEKARLNTQVFSRIRVQARAALDRGQSVVVDATNLSRKRRMNFLSQLGRVNCVKKCLLFVAPVDICLERNRLRTGNARVPEYAMTRMLRSFECPYYWEGWDEIDTVADTTPYRFPFEEVRGLDQDNPHHTLTLDEHMATAVRFCRERGFGQMLERVAAYHDIGKLPTRQYRNSRGEPTPHAHYYEHENYGAYLYLAERCCGQDLSPEELRQILYETCLINCHMRPLTGWQRNESAREKDRKLFGEAFLADLTALHLADRAAH